MWRAETCGAPSTSWCAAGSSAADADPETVIALVLRALEVPDAHWVSYFTQELARLHGWAGFIRWRSNTSHYYWEQRFPGDLVDYMAVRTLLALTLLRKRAKGRMPFTFTALSAAHRVAAGRGVRPQRVSRIPGASRDGACAGGRADAAQQGAHEQAVRDIPRPQARVGGRTPGGPPERAGPAVSAFPISSEGCRRTSCATLLAASSAFRKREGMIWLEAMEAKAMDGLLRGLNLAPTAPREKRPFAKALFCIDTRSERIRRNLESVGDYQTYGIAGFFGVPVSFMELGKGSENHLCPVLLTPKNLVVEMTSTAAQDKAALSALEKAMHELKESVLTPFVTVEAIGLLFGLDMVGKTLLPTAYNHWRRHLHESKPDTHLVVDKLGREQADSIVRAVQRAVIVKAVEQELDLEPEQITDDMVRELRECALGNRGRLPRVCRGGRPGRYGRRSGSSTGCVTPIESTSHSPNCSWSAWAVSVSRWTSRPGSSRRPFSRSGSPEDFSRFILLIGHGSSSENNPYESALDCGACGGSHGLVSARVLAQMANKPEVRRRLRANGIDIPDDAWFVPALHNTTTDEIRLHDLALLPPSHLMYLDRLRNGLSSASRLCAQERLPTLEPRARVLDPAAAARAARRNAMDWSQVRPEWGLSRNAYFIIGRRSLTQSKALDGRAFLHSYDYRVDPKRRLLENILTGPLVVGQWINMEHYFSTVDNVRFGSGSKVYHNVAGRFGVMTGNSKRPAHRAAGTDGARWRLSPTISPCG